MRYSTALFLGLTATILAVATAGTDIERGHLLRGDGTLPGGYDSDRAVLEELHQSTQGQQWREAAGWGQYADHCNWHGVTCSVLMSQQSRVISLNLSGNRLTGSIPAALGRLSELKKLNLLANNLSGSVPAELGNLKKLTYLRLDYNQLSGELPSALNDIVSGLDLCVMDHNKSLFTKDKTTADHCDLSSA